MSRRLGGRGLVAAAVLVGMLGAGCSAGHRRETILIGPSFHSAGVKAKEELQAVLEDQARSITASDWRGLFELHVPTERSRCDYEQYAVSAEETFGSLRDQAQGTVLSADVTDVKVSGFRASVDYRLVLADYGLSTPPQQAHYLKLADRWFLDEKAC
jgi:hypothetical protein